jgi:hypothetical protein
MDKRLIVEKIREELRAQFERVKRAADTAREDATDEESRARSKYETQGLEASYLAAGQAGRAEDLALAMETLSAEPFRAYGENDFIDEGALVEVDLGGEHEWFLLTPCSGGLTLRVEGKEVTLLGPGAPLREELLGLEKGAKVKARGWTVRSLC